MIITIDKKEYLVKVGNKAILNLNKVIASGIESIGFKEICDAYWDSIREKGKLTYEQIEDYVDVTPEAIQIIMAELEAFKALQEVAKK